MIDVRKIPNEELSSCNCCGKYNKQFTFLKTNEEQTTKDTIYEYTMHYGYGGLCIRLCKDCAKDLIINLIKQVEE